jgi:RHS repeat-associated protein
MYEYDAFGGIRVLDEEGALIPIEDAIPNPYTFTGREYDPETGLYYYRARYYDPGLGRFLQEDPILQMYSDLHPACLGCGVDDLLSPVKRRLSLYIERPQELNLYPYVINNPLNYIDPTGLVYETTAGTEILRCMRRLKFQDRIMYKWLKRSVEECYKRWGIPPLPAYLHHMLRGITKNGS